MKTSRWTQGLAAPWRADAALSVLVVLIVAMMIVPLPTPLLDVLIASNLGFAVLLLLGALYSRDGMSLTALPSLLLITTLYRLALNVSSTRLILLQADAGSIIRAFGEFVVRGDYLVGGVIFLILTLIQYVVIARGAERVAEVGARFSLDAMPGKQLAIDSDLRLGLLTAATANQRRSALSRENQLYGAMDGAMKFVKGDAIASIAISVINLVAGAAIGVSSRGLDLVTSLKTYGLLTVGDGLVSQIPALLISTAAAIVVTRVASEDAPSSLARDIGDQLFGSSRVLWAAAALLTLLSLIPGLPWLPLFLVACSAAALALITQRRGATPAVAGETRGTEARVVVKLGRLSPDLQDSVERVLPARVYDACGVSLDVVAQLEPSLSAQRFQLWIDDVPSAEGDVAELLPRSSDALCRHAPSLFGIEQTQQLLESIARTQPTVVRNLVPTPLSLSTLALVLQRLLDDGVSLRHAHVILDSLATIAPRETEVGKLAARARAALQRQRSQSLAPQGTLSVFQLDPLVTDVLRQAWREGLDTEQLALTPQMADSVVNAVREAVAASTEPVLLTAEPVRRAAHTLLKRELPTLRVISAQDLSPDVEVTTLAWIGPNT